MGKIDFKDILQSLIYYEYDVKSKVICPTSQSNASCIWDPGDQISSCTCWVTFWYYCDNKCQDSSLSGSLAVCLQLTGPWSHTVSVHC